MRYLKLLKTHDDYVNIKNSLDDLFVVYDNNHVHYSNRDFVALTVQDLINEGYARVIKQTDINSSADSSGYAVEILDTCPYGIKNIIDFKDILENKSQVDDAVDGYNTFIWRSLPDGWKASDIASIYSESVIDTVPLGGIFGLDGVGIDFSGVNNMSVTFDREENWKMVYEYPWGTFPNIGGKNLFGCCNYSPKNFTAHFTKNVSSIAQRMFKDMKNLETLTIISDGNFRCHDFSGCFEGCRKLSEIKLQGKWYWVGTEAEGGATYNYMFNYCNNLKEIPLSPISNNREAFCNTICPKLNSYGRGRNNFYYTFAGCDSLESIKPTIDATQMTQTNVISFETPNLTDVHFKNLNNCSWSFVSTKFNIPKMNVESIEYALNNIGNCGTNNYTIKFSNLHASEVSQSAIQHASDSGWNVVFGDSNYNQSFNGWVVNSNALADYDLTDSKLTIRKFKPNVWLMKYVPDAQEGKTMNEVIFEYAHNMQVIISGIADKVDDVITWYPTGSNYYCRGLLISPLNSSNSCRVAAYPWEMGVPSGYFKNPNGGAMRYGFTTEGLVNVYSYNSSHTYPENSAASLGLLLYTNYQTDADGYITLDEPIIISLYAET